MSNFSHQEPDPQDPFVKWIGDFLRDGTLLQGSKAHTLLIALSGGPDSTALLAALVALRQALSFQLVALHVNHRLRGDESDEDENFCRKLCGERKVAFHVERLSGHVKDESGLREARYLALTQIATQTNADIVLTGHTLDDQVETLLFRMFRGTGPAGMKGMEAVRKLNDHLALVRPMLGVGRNEVLAFLNRIGLEARFDSSNADEGYARNFLRHTVVPAIESRFPGANERLDRLRMLIAEDEEMLDLFTDDAYRRVTLDIDEAEIWSLDAFLAERQAIRRRLVARALRSRSIELTFDRTEQILNAAAQRRGAVSLDARWDVQCEQSRIIWLEKISATDDSAHDVVPPEFEETLQVPGVTVSLRFGCAVHVEALLSTVAPVAAPEFPPADSDEALVDLSSVTGTLVLRERQQSDQIRPFGMAELVKLKKYLHTHKPSRPLKRIRQLVLADQQEVLWVPGVGLSNKLKVRNQPTHRIRLMSLAADEVEIV